MTANRPAGAGPEQFRPTFSTSQEAQEERAEERAEQGHYFGARVSTSEGSKPFTGRSRPLTRGMKPVEPKPLPVALTDRQRKQLKKKS